MFKTISHYAGWDIHHRKAATICIMSLKGFSKPFREHELFSATRAGVSMNTNSFEGIKKMIDQKNFQMREWRKIGFSS